MTFDPGVLFDTVSALHPKYGSIRDELSAVSDGSKGMSVLMFPTSSMSLDPGYAELIDLATELQLKVVCESRSEIDTDIPSMTYVFIVKHKDHWAIPAYVLVKQIFDQYGWCDAAEHLESRLLGYTETDIASWLLNWANSRIGWDGKTLYMLLSSEQADCVSSLGMRSIKMDPNSNSIQVCFSRQRRPVLKEALSVIPARTVLARVSVAEGFFRRLFADPINDVGDIVTADLHREMATSLNVALKSNFQFLTHDGWS